MKRIIIIILLLQFFMTNQNHKMHNKIYNLQVEGNEYLCTYSGSELIIYDSNSNEYNPILLLQEDIILDMSVSDLNSDDTDELLIISAEEGENYGKDICFFTPSLKSGTLVIEQKYSNDFTSVKPWDIQVCDIDGDNIKDIYIGVYKSTPMYSAVENRPFFFNWDGEKFSKKWTGSKLEYPFETVIFDNVIGDTADEFIVVEYKENKMCVSIYYWLDFGFVKFSESSTYPNITTVKPLHVEDRVYLEVTTSAFKKPVLLKLKGEQLIEVNNTKI